jgi:hypothetical protein
MGTSLVTGRVDSEIKAQADAYIARTGQTQASVIRSVWGAIARTGRIPTIDDVAATDSLKARMRDLRRATPRSEFLEGLTPAGLKEELAHRG